MVKFRGAVVKFRGAVIKSRGAVIKFRVAATKLIESNRIDSLTAVAWRVLVGVKRDSVSYLVGDGNGRTLPSTLPSDRLYQAARRANCGV